MKKTIIISVCIVIVCALALAGTFAYLQDTDSDVNVMTMGKVDITLDEAAVDENGEAIDGADRVLGNEYKLVPGKSYLKDPTVTVKAGSEKAYIRALITVHNASAYKDITKGDHSLMFAELTQAGSKWEIVNEKEDASSNTVMLELRFSETVEGKESGEDKDVVLPAIFETLTVPGDATTEQMKALDSPSAPFTVQIIGNAVQCAGFEDADAAWAAFDEQSAVSAGIKGTNA